MVLLVRTEFVVRISSISGPRCWVENNRRWDLRSSMLERKESRVLSTFQGVPFCSSKSLQRSSPYDQLSIWVGGDD
ncbi:hypothetical protein BHE74_00045107 [Ensete ventricosum]|uniref:Uncharacterized protein n=1 Tax=Ensete ventricosum TaxID=4639 RepID=A0A444CHF9_ENSVE|nr:hypothetical protein B296_00058487 [Ensete ventricosum]RWV85261.1 hypothetical protein GW17_00052958 [Ensete ventricosum]RWW48789.1 hypothetical protein BHE74_00045107 [Ensete ventricosum]RZS24360.1 hypothetical protein BHM03_00057417 [Ensete ventricosum]